MDNIVTAKKADLSLPRNESLFRSINEFTSSPE
jgi:hypothetical protein